MICSLVLLLWLLLGTEIEEEVVQPAIQRIGRGWAALERGELLASVAGCRRTIAEQVFFCGDYNFFFLHINKWLLS